MSIPVWPGGYLLGWVLVLNLIAAHFKRFKFSRKKVGILLTHAGVLMLLVGQFLTELFQVESFMRLEEGETRSYSESHRKTELAIVEMTGDSSRVTVIPDSVLQKRGEVHHPKLTFTLRVKEWHANSEPQFNRQDGLTFKRSAVTAKPDEMNFPVVAVEISANGTNLHAATVSSFLSNERAAASIGKWLWNEFGIDPAAGLEAMQGGVERPLFHRQRFFGQSVNVLRDGIAVHRLDGQRLEHQHFERPGKQRFFRHRQSMPMTGEEAGRLVAPMT